MADETRHVNVVVRLRDTATRGLKALGRTFQRITRSAANVGRAFRTMARNVTLLTAAAVAGVVALQRWAKRGSEVLNVTRAFSQQTGNATKALRALRVASQGLISDYDLMAGLNRALTLGSARNVEEFGKLTRTAITLGAALGVDAALALESLSLGIGRQSRLLLDNLGIIVKVEQANRAYAKANNKNVADLTELEKRTAFTNAAFEAADRAIAELGESTENTGDKATRLGVAFLNTKDEIAAILAQSEKLGAFFDGLATTVKNFVLAIEGAGFAEAFKALGVIAVSAFNLAFIAGLEELDAAVRSLPLVGTVAGAFEKLGIGVDVEASKARQQANLTAGQTLLRTQAAAGVRPQPRGAGAPTPERLRSATQLEPLEVSLGPSGGLFGPGRALTAGEQWGIDLGFGDPRTLKEQGRSPGVVGAGPGTGTRDAPTTITKAAQATALFTAKAQNHIEITQRAARAQDRAAKRLELGSTIAISGVGAVAEALINFESPAQAFIGTITRMATALLPKPFGALAGAVGGILGAVIGRNNKPVPVELVRVKPEAVEAFPLKIVNIIEVPETGEVLRQTEYLLKRFENLDGINRIPRAQFGGVLGSTGGTARG